MMMNEVTGKHILSFTVLHQIGKGGMSTVYEAVHDKLETKVAIKILDPILAANDGIRERFVQEAKIMASLNHEGITRVSDFEEKDNRLAIVMEYLDGQTLDEYVKQKGAFSAATAKEIMLKILDAFVYAHEKGVVHRDVKPSNIFLTKEGRVKIMDFGIAKLVEEGAKVLTSTGAQMGTPVYMSPEQVNDAKHIDHRTDIYSLGVTFWFMLAGKTPYDTEKESNFSIYKKIDSEPLPELRIDQALNMLIQKATAKSIDERIPSCDELIKLLKNNTTPRSSEETLVIEDVDQRTSISEKPNLFQKPVETNKPKEAYPIPKSQNGLYGYVAQTGEKIIPFIYEEAHPFSEGIATVSKNDSWHIINLKGELIKSLDYDNVGSFNCGRARVVKRKKRRSAKMLYGFIDTEGNAVIDPQYEWARDFSEGLAVVCEKEGTHGAINTKGEIVIPLKYTKLLKPSNGLIKACKSELWGMLNTKGEIVIPCIYADLHNVSEGLIAAKQFTESTFFLHYGFLNMNGEVCIPFIYTDVEDFKNGRAKVRQRKNIFKTEQFYIDKTGKRLK